MTANPDPAGVHDIRTMKGIMICARCYWRAALERFPHRFPERCEPDVPVHLSDWRGEISAPRCGAPREEAVRFQDDRTPVTCPDCRTMIDAQPRLGSHDLRKWGQGALCARCGERAGDPDTLGPCVPPPPPSPRSFLPHAACDPLDRDGPVLCGAAATRRDIVTLLRIDAYVVAARCPACLEAALLLSPYASGLHDLRLGGDGVICPVCGIAAATPEDAGGCPGDVPVEMLRRRNAGEGRLAGTLSGTRHAPGGGCRHAPPAGAGTEWGTAAGGSRRFRVTCLNCIRRAAGLPHAIGIAA